MAEQRYQAVLAVIGEGRTVTEVAAQWRVSRQTLHRWLGRYGSAFDVVVTGAVLITRRSILMTRSIPKGRIRKRPGP